MIPLLWLFFGWVLAVGFFLLLALFTVSLALRFGLTGISTFTVCLIFLFVAGTIIMISGTYLLSVDWNQTLTLMPVDSTSSNLLFP